MDTGKNCTYGSVIILITSNAICGYKDPSYGYFYVTVPILNEGDIYICGMSGFFVAGIPLNLHKLI